MDHDLVGYLLGLLDPDDRVRTESALRHDPTLRGRLDRLRTALAPLESGRTPEAPPAGLAERTLALVSAHSAFAPVDDRPRPARRVSAVPAREPLFQPSRWRRADALVAALILVVLGGLGTSGLGRLQQRHKVTVCQNNLRELHQALNSYCDQNDNRYPQVQEQPPYNVAGAFVPMLRDGGLLPATGLPSCPTFVVAGGADVPAGGYAYTLGYRDAQGHLHGLTRDDSPCGNDLLPILSDRAMPVAHGTGHNVLFIGGHVRYCTTPRVGVDGDDIFLNQASEVSAGLHRLDTVLGAGNTSP
jgi:prepilin-type processing-associated H-X9-DG protein